MQYPESKLCKIVVEQLNSSFEKLDEIVLFIDHSYHRFLMVIDCLRDNEIPPMENERLDWYLTKDLKFFGPFKGLNKADIHHSDIHSGKASRQTMQSVNESGKISSDKFKSKFLNRDRCESKESGSFEHDLKEFNKSPITTKTLSGKKRVNSKTHA